MLVLRYEVAVYRPEVYKIDSSGCGYGGVKKERHGGEQGQYHLANHLGRVVPNTELR